MVETFPKSRAITINTSQPRLIANQFRNTVNLQKKEFYEHRCMAVPVLVVFVVPVYGISVFFGFGGKPKHRCHISF